MKRSQLLDLLVRVAGQHPETSFIVTGAEAIHSYLPSVSASVEENNECFLLLIGESTRARHPIEEEFGKKSYFSAEHRVSARTIGLASVGLPAGWKERLVRFEQDARLRMFRALEMHDYAVSVLHTAEEEGLALLVDLFRNGLLEPATLQHRTQSASDPQAIAFQLQRLILRLEKAGLKEPAARLGEIVTPVEAAPPDQLALFFDASPGIGKPTGLDAWREEQNEKQSKVASARGLPIGKHAHVTLRNGVRLKGKLILCEQKGSKGGKLRAGDLVLRIDAVDFRASEIESCVREDS